MFMLAQVDAGKAADAETTLQTILPKLVPRQIGIHCPHPSLQNRVRKALVVI